MHVVILTHLISPYQVELFNTVAASNKIKLKVIYLHQSSPTRLWARVPIQHDFICIEDCPGQSNEIRSITINTDLTIFNYYAEKNARDLLNARAQSGKPWCFWGERPGIRKPEWVGRLVRRKLLAPLHNSRAAIWGIGEFALDAYKREYGLQHQYSNLPYFSDLTRFQNAIDHKPHNNSDRVFLFSGSLIKRKGVDLLASTFVSVAQEFPFIRLRLMGVGNLQNKIAKILSPVKDQVDFLGFKDWKNLPEYYSNADVLCVPSRYDGWGLVVPEGLATGLPVIGTNRMGAAIELIKSGNNGWLIPADNESALYLALREAASMTRQELEVMSTNARESVSQHSLENGAERLINLAQRAYENWVS